MVVTLKLNRPKAEFHYTAYLWVTYSKLLKVSKLQCLHLEMKISIPTSFSCSD